MINSRQINLPDIIPLVRYFRSIDANSVGGNLHIYLDEGNIEDDHIKFCLGKCIESGDFLGESICRLSLRLSKTQRTKLSRNFYD